MQEELFDIVDENDQVIGVAARSECHGNPALIHRTAHVVVINSYGELLLQKRSAAKDILPGYWDTAVGGHLDRGEEYLQAARREMNEELGFAAGQPLEFLFHSKIRNTVESENTAVYLLRSDGPFSHDPGEIDELRFWSVRELNRVLYADNGGGADDTERFTPNLVIEIRRLSAAGLLSGIG